MVSPKTNKYYYISIIFSYTSYLRGGDGYCAIENININSVDTFNGGYPLKSYE